MRGLKFMCFELSKEVKILANFARSLASANLACEDYLACEKWLYLARILEELGNIKEEKNENF